MNDSIAYEIIDDDTVLNSTFDKSMPTAQSKGILQKISDALLIGNSYHTKVSIVYQDDYSIKKVITTVWASGNKYICLKGGLWIPLDRIMEVELV